MIRWRLVAALLAASAASAAGAVILHWQPCRGFMLDASVLTGFADGNFSDACLRRMDGGLPFPYPPEPAEFTLLATGLGTAAMVLAALGGLVLALGVRASAPLRGLLMAPAVLTGVTALVSARAAADPGRNPDGYLSLWLWGSAELAAVVAVIALGTARGRHIQLSRRTFWVILVMVWSTTMFGLVHQGADYLLMLNFSEADWDTPPGTGTLTVVGLLLGAVVAAVQAAHRPAVRHPDRPGQPLSRVTAP